MGQNRLVSLASTILKHFGNPRDIQNIEMRHQENSNEGGLVFISDNPVFASFRCSSGLKRFVRNAASRTHPEITSEHLYRKMCRGVIGDETIWSLNDGNSIKETYPILSACEG